MTLIKYNRPSTGRGISPVFNQLFNDFFENFSTPSIRNGSIPALPSVNVAENNSEFLMELSAPGFSKEEVSISVEDNNLVIIGEKKSETEEGDKKYSRKEFSYQNFRRSFNLPEEINQEKINGKIENGIIHISLPKKQVENKIARKIELN